MAFSFLISLVMIISLSKTTNAIDSSYHNFIGLGIIEAVYTPHELNELGFKQLGKQPVYLSANPSLMRAIKRVNRELMQMPENAKLSFPVGTNSPIRIGEIPNDTGHQVDSRSDEYEATGYVDSSGNAQSITAGDGAAMTRAALSGTGHLLRHQCSLSRSELSCQGNTSTDFNSQHILVADASRIFLQARRYPTINLIVRHKRTGRQAVIVNANLYAVKRDLLNAVLNQTLRIY
ncbi:hypothetical protein AP9108_30030 [Arthrospira sp. PCC 9108]|nr:hypothetical protein AP9108_30030 [Arthrospira sp. PCC 9108]